MTMLFTEEERRPAGTGGLVALAGNRVGDPLPDLCDCLVLRPRPRWLVIWEPLLTKAPSPAIVRPYCCYIKTIIFYDAHNRLELRKRWWRSQQDDLLREERRGFEVFDKVETRLTWDMPVSFEGDVFEARGGRVVWASEGRRERRWWMCRVAGRRAEDREAA